MDGLGSEYTSRHLMRKFGIPNWRIQLSPINCKIISISVEMILEGIQAWNERLRTIFKNFVQHRKQLEMQISENSWC